MKSVHIDDLVGDIPDFIDLLLELVDALDLEVAQVANIPHSVDHSLHLQLLGVLQLVHV